MTKPLPDISAEDKFPTHNRLINLRIQIHVLQWIQRLLVDLVPTK